MPTNDAIEALEAASKGLLYTSETDEPFEVFRWKAEGELTADKVRKRARKPAKAPVEEVTLAEFFAGPTTEEDWNGDEEKQTVEQYRQLLKAVRQHLADAKVFKVGARKLGVYIVGRTDEGDWAGLKTTAVET